MVKYKILWASIIMGGLVSTSFVSSAEPGRTYERSKSQVSKKDEVRRDYRKAKVVNTTSVHRKAVIVAPRHRSYRNIIVVRPHGHVYLGYGAFYNDNDAYKWLAFTAITLKILDNVNEEAQRKHEAAQISATSAAIGEKITWDSTESSGYVVTTKEGKSSEGLTCREFQQEITVGGNTEQAFGTACLQADGAWKIIS